MLPLRFLHALEIDLGYLAQPPTGTGSPEKKFNCKNLYFGLKFRIQRLSPYNFQASGNVLTKLLQET